LSFHIRAFKPEEDIPSLVNLRAEIEAVDQVGTNTSEAAVQAQMKWRGHDPSRDRWVVETTEAPGRFLGHAWIFAQSPTRSILSVAVHPAWRRRGLGSSLLQKALHRADETGAHQLVSATEANNTAGRTFLEVNHFFEVGHNRFLSAPSIAPLPAVEFPSGFTLQSFETINNLSLLVKACNECYRDMWGHRENTEASTEGFYSDMMQDDPEYFPPAGIFILFAPDHRVAGVSFCRMEAGQKIIDSPAIVPAFHTPGLLRYLVLASMHWLNNQAEGDIQLQTWGDSENAVQVYKELGFTLDENNHVIEYLLAGDKSLVRSNDKEEH